MTEEEEHWLLQLVSCLAELGPVPDGTYVLWVDFHVHFQVWRNFQAVFSPEYRRTTYMMMAVWFSMSFR